MERSGGISSKVRIYNFWYKIRNKNLFVYNLYMFAYLFSSPNVVSKADSIRAAENLERSDGISSKGSCIKY